MPYAIELAGVEKRFDRVAAVQDLSFTVPRGALLGFIGPNGSGKTTTLRLIVGLLEPDAGVVRVLGAAPRRAVDRVGYLPEERGLYRRMTVHAVITYYARLKGARPRPRDVDGWLDRLGVLEHARAPVESLSKGTAQKVQLAAAVVTGPELLVLDEPFSGLDPVGVETLRETILDLRRSGATVLLSTHDMSMAERLCDSVVMLHAGRKVLDGTPAEIAERHGGPVVRARVDGPLPELPEIERAVDRGECHELLLRDPADAPRVLQRLATGGRLLRFEVARPSLHDVFLRVARPTPDAEG